MTINNPSTIKITHEFAPGDRYLYDFGACSGRNGFAQCDTRQDASYFGVWANPLKRLIFSFCEGDTTLTECSTPDAFVREVRRTVQFYIDNGDWIGIDTMLNDEVTAEFERLELGELLCS